MIVLAECTRQEKILAHKNIEQYFRTTFQTKDFVDVS